MIYPSLNKNVTIYPNGSLLDGKIEGADVTQKERSNIVAYAKNGSLVVNYKTNQVWIKSCGEWLESDILKKDKENDLSK